MRFENESRNIFPQSFPDRNKSGVEFVGVPQTERWKVKYETAQKIAVAFFGGAWNRNVHNVLPPSSLSSGEPGAFHAQGIGAQMEARGVISPPLSKDIIFVYRPFQGKKGKRRQSPLFSLF